jgi:small-conductance mechanosensitive channel
MSQRPRARPRRVERRRRTWLPIAAFGAVSVLCWIPVALLGAAALLWIPVTARAAGEAADDLRETKIVTAPVTLDGELLFRVRGVPALPAEERSRLIAERIAAVAEDPGVTSDSLRIVETEGRSDILAGEHLIASIVDADAVVEDVKRPTLAMANLHRIQGAIAAYRRDRRPEMLKGATVRSVAALVGLLAGTLLVVFLWRRARRWIEDRIERRLKSITFQSLELVQAERIRSTLHGALGALATVAVLGLGLACLSYVLAQFPWTRHAGYVLARAPMAPLGRLGADLVGSLPDLVFVAVAIVVTRYALGLVLLFFGAVDRGTVKLGKFDPEWAWPTYRIVRLLILALVAAVAYPSIPGSNTEAFRGISIFLGVVFSLGASGVIGNIIAGYSMIYRRTFKVGDRVKIGDVVGDVTEMRLQVTHLRSPKNEEVIVPNSQILDKEVVNYSIFARDGQLILHATVGIGYETPWRQVEALLLLAAGRTEGLRREPPPFVLERGLGDFAVTYEVNAYCGDARAMARTYAGLYRNILDVFNEYGVQIMTPAYEGDPERPKIVEKQHWFEAPARQDTDGGYPARLEGPGGPPSSPQH